MGKIHNAGTSLLTVINDILDFSKIEAGRLDIETIPFTLDHVIQQVAVVTGEKAHEKGLEFLVDFPPGIPQNLLGDPLRLGQVLTNLVNNAVKFTGRGEIRLKAELLERTGDKAKLRFSVRDTGIGMSAGPGGQAVPSLHPGGHVHHAQARRHRPRPDHLAPAGGADGRADLAGEHAGRGQHLHLHGLVRAGLGRRPTWSPPSS